MPLAFFYITEASPGVRPHHWHAALWRYEHIYKLLASLFVMLSAAAGKLLHVGQPWTQLASSVLGPELHCVVLAAAVSKERLILTWCRALPAAPFAKQRCATKKCRVFWRSLTQCQVNCLAR